MEDEFINDGCYGDNRDASRPGTTGLDSNPNPFFCQIDNHQFRISQLQECFPHQLVRIKLQKLSWVCSIRYTHRVHPVHSSQFTNDSQPRLVGMIGVIFD